MVVVMLVFGLLYSNRIILISTDSNSFLYNRNIYILRCIQIYMDITTIRIHKEILKSLRKHELHPRETNEDIIKRLIAWVKK